MLSLVHWQVHPSLRGLCRLVRKAATSCDPFKKSEAGQAIERGHNPPKPCATGKQSSLPQSPVLPDTAFASDVVQQKKRKKIKIPWLFDFSFRRLCRYRLRLAAPLELCAVDPHPMHDDGKLAGDRDAGVFLG